MVGELCVCMSYVALLCSSCCFYLAHGLALCFLSLPSSSLCSWLFAVCFALLCLPVGLAVCFAFCFACCFDVCSQCGFALLFVLVFALLAALLFALFSWFDLCLLLYVLLCMLRMLEACVEAFLNPAGCCRRPEFFVAPCFCWIVKGTSLQ